MVKYLKFRPWSSSVEVYIQSDQPNGQIYVECGFMIRYLVFHKAQQLTTWADTVVHLLLLQSSMPRRVSLFKVSLIQIIGFVLYLPIVIGSLIIIIQTCQQSFLRPLF